ncbi:MAG: hypothetical protein AB1716_00370 [Planctomycetota bacterium]
MPRKLMYAWFPVVGLLCVAVAWAGTPLGTAFTYQGQLKFSGQPGNGRESLRFELYDAATAGNRIASTTAPSVDVVDGLFTVAIDFGANAFNGEARWVEVAVYETGMGWVVLTPRQPILAAPYALYALDGGGEGGACLWSQNGSDIYYNAGRVGVGTGTPAYPLHVYSAAARAMYAENGAASGASFAVYGRATGTGGRGVYGEATAASGTTSGVEGYAHSPTGHAVYGFNEAESGNGYAIRGDNGSPNGIAVFGYAANDTGAGTTIGVKGQIDNATGAALYGDGGHRQRPVCADGFHRRQRRVRAEPEHEWRQRRRLRRGLEPAWERRLRLQRRLDW